MNLSSKFELLSLHSSFLSLLLYTVDPRVVLPLHQLFQYRSFFLSIRLSVSLSVCLSVCLSFFLSECDLLTNTAEQGHPYVFITCKLYSIQSMLMVDCFVISCAHFFLVISLLALFSMFMMIYVLISIPVCRPSDCLINSYAAKFTEIIGAARI